MTENQSMLDDVMALGGSLFKTLLEQRHALRQDAQGTLSRLLGSTNHVAREEFDVAFAMLAKIRVAQDSLDQRLTRIETKLNLSRTSSTVRRTKAYLPSVKNRNRKNKKV